MGLLSYILIGELIQITIDISIVALTGWLSSSE